jgi:pimeloyl-ACP methyl ester carboxylesterase
VHGLWLNGWESALLRRRLSRELRCPTRTYAYRSVSADVTANARGLAEFLAQTLAATRLDTLHLVGHSLGGLVILRLFEHLLTADERLIDGTPLPPGRIVLLGSPVRGSRAAQRFARVPFGKRIMGLTAGQVLLRPCERRWSGTREVGIIAGDLPLGLGRVVGPFDSANDGTVLVAETRLDGAREHVTLRTNHTGLIYSADVARHTAAFLRDGAFGR